MLSILSISLAFFLAFLGRLFFIEFNSRCNPLICHWFYVALFVTIDAESALLPLAVVFCAAMVGVESVLLPLAVVCCAAMEEELSRVYSLALLSPGFGIFSRRSWTVQGLGVGDLRAVDTAPILSKLLVDNPELLLPKQVVGSTEPGLPQHLVDDIEPVLPKQATVMENSAVGVSLT
ncbi:hypothetical protein V6N13_051447 [Hibiscus sabdariffa]